MTDAATALSDYRRLLGSDASPRPALRVNTIKGTLAETVARLEAHGIALSPVPWCPDGFFHDREDFTMLAEHGLGLVYSQDAASMLPAVVVAPRPGERVLDLCAAPGSKTSQMAAMMRNRGTIVANDISGGRAYVCAAVLQRMGVMNTILTRADGSTHGFSGIVFDRVLVDAPCSNLSSWARVEKGGDAGPSRARALASVQRRLLENAARRVKPGGRVVYSTCSVAPEENEEVVARVVADGVLEPDDLGVVIGEAAPLAHVDAGLSASALRLSPGSHGTEAFFVAALRRPSDAG